MNSLWKKLGIPGITVGSVSYPMRYNSNQYWNPEVLAALIEASGSAGGGLIGSEVNSAYENIVLPNHSSGDRQEMKCMEDDDDMRIHKIAASKE